MTRVAAERVPAAKVCWAANRRAIQTGTVVRANLDRNEHDADERCGSKGEDQVAGHGQFLWYRVATGRRPAVSVPTVNNFSQEIVPPRRGDPPHQHGMSIGVAGEADSMSSR